MSLRQNRRRRVLTDESASIDFAETQRTPQSTTTSYAPAVERVQVRRVLDLLPMRYRTLVLLFAGGVTVIAGLEVLHVWLPEIARLTPIENLTAIDLASGRCVANWFSSCLVGVTALVGLLIYALRRQRVDDYHGRYRLWLWTVAALLAMSVDEIAELHRLGPAVLSWATVWCTLTEAQLWGIVAGIAAGVLVLRLLFEMRDSKLSLAALVAATACLTGEAALEHGWISVTEGLNSIVLASSLRMTGHLLLFFALMVYARHVVRDVAGLVPARERKVKRRKASKPAPDKEAAASVSVDQAHKPRPHFSTSSDLKSVRDDDEPRSSQPARGVATATRSATATAREEVATAVDTRGMTRAERKRLRRQMKQDQDSDD